MRGHRDNPLESVDKSKYGSFDLTETGSDEYGPYWVARVSMGDMKFITGNYYCVVEPGDAAQNAEVLARQVAEIV